ncbi:MAG: hypothetical protein OHK0028_10570 [Deltaproteobacteria bacterium]
MRRLPAIPVFLYAALAVSLSFGVRDAAADTVRISGTGGATGTMKILAGAFQRAHPGIRVEIQPGMGSSGSIRAVRAGKLEIGLSGRRLSAGEKAQGLLEVKYARTPFVFAVHRSVRISGLTTAGLAEIYAGRRDWEDGRRLRLVLRPAEDSDIPVLKGISPAMSAAVDIAMRRRGMIVATTDHDAADAIESVPGAFGGTTLALVLSEKRPIRVLALDGVTPGIRTMADRSYRITKTFSMVTGRNPSAAARRFIDFVFSPAGAAVLSKCGQEPFRRGGGSP